MTSCFVFQRYILKNENWQQCQKHEALIENVSESYLSLNIKKKGLFNKKKKRFAIKFRS